jgi:hypothetical protein
VSKKAAKRTKTATALPLESAHWWTLDKMRGYCHERLGDRRNADLALLARVNTGKLPEKLPGKIIWFDEQTSPAEQHAMLLSVEDYELKAVDFYKVWYVQPRRPDVPVLPRPALFFWGPKAKELWPMEEEAEPSRRSREQELIREIAAEIWPNGYEHVRTETIIKRVGDKIDRMGFPVPKRDVFLRALDRRKG